jgi:hypothetical protein
VATYFGNVNLFDGTALRTKAGVLVADGHIDWVGRTLGPLAPPPRRTRSTGPARPVAAYAFGKASAVAERARDAFRRSVRAGLTIVCGTDAGTPFNPHGSATREIVRMVEWGLTPLKAMQAATSKARRCEAPRGSDASRRARPPTSCCTTRIRSRRSTPCSRPALVMKAGEAVHGSV